ncbi:hypothetical protein [Microbacterium dextranolyticum]|uniref:Uncharacterized protein n=1 Tax=Microbacterium dextranolyticum TaxID=36806 RepID=A0A9W6M6N4_9MICO|nr:hypothetical protein [Microbacterium dextranolyticum]MBM7462833.1 hypothetical protein [Microbacterium dextranolyticum]GLJ96062.1 hypothetical protein GCM10017591_21250 [Microbacterium dextranolyticum]
MSQRLLFPDGPTAADALTFAQRASRLGDGAVRLVARDGVLLLTAAPLAPRTLLEPTPTVLGMRAVSVDPELVCDLTVDAAALAADVDSSSLRLPDSAVTATWAGVSPPRAGWSDEGTIPAATLAERAQWGIATVAEGVPTDAGDDAVHTVRAAVWGAPDDALQGLPLGVAFAAFALGFIAGEEAAVVRRNGPWARISFVRGHVLTRGTVRSGLTAVRPTGA